MSDKAALFYTVGFVSGGRDAGGIVWKEFKTKREAVAALVGYRNVAKTAPRTYVAKKG